MNLQIIRRFPRDTNIRRQQFQFEDAFKGFINSPATSPPHQAEDPTQPRFVMTDGKRTLSVSEVNVALNMEFGSPPKDGIYSALEKAIFAFSELDVLLDKQTRYYTGLVVDFIFQPRDRLDVIREIAKTSFPSIERDFTSLDIQMGTEQDGHLVNAAVQEVFRFDFEKMMKERSPSPFAQGFYIDPDFEDINYRFMQLRLDINTKNTLSAPTAGQARRIFGSIEKAFEVGGLLVPGDIIDVARKAYRA